MSPGPKNPTPVLGVPAIVSNPRGSDSDEFDAVALVEESQRIAALSQQPVQFQIDDINRRLIEGNRRIGRMRTRIEELHEQLAQARLDFAQKLAEQKGEFEAKLATLENTVTPRVTPARALRTTVTVVGAVVAVVGWVLAMNQYAKADDLRDVAAGVQKNAVDIGKIEGRLSSVQKGASTP